MSGTSRTRAALALIFLLTFGVRLAYYESNPRPDGQPWLWGALAHNIASDGHWFQLNANAGRHFAFNAPLTKGERLVSPDEVDLKYADTHPRWVPFVFEPMGESVLLAGVWKVTGDQSYEADVLMKIVLDAFAALLVYRIAMRLFKRPRAALLAGLLYALYPPIAQVVVSSSRDFWSIDFTIAILAIYLEAINSPRPGRWLVAGGALTGIGAYFATGVLILPSAMALAGIAVAGWRTTLYRASLMTAIAVLLIVPWTIRNYEEFHRLIPVRLGIGENLWSGLAEVSNRYGLTHKDYGIYEVVRRARPNFREMSPEWDAYLGNRATSVIKQDPAYYLRTVARHLWRSTFGELDLEWAHGVRSTPFAYSGGPIAYAYEQPYQLLQFMLIPLVFLLAMLSLGLTWLRYKHEHLLLVAVAVATVLPYLFLSLEPRYLMPIAMCYLIWIGLGSDLLLERFGLLRTRASGRAEGATAP